MKSTPIFKPGSFQNLLVVMFTMLFMVIAVDAMAWQRNVSRTGAQGKTASRNITANRTGNGFTRTTTATGPQGNTATRSAQGVWDPATKTWTKNVTATGAGGQTATRNTTAVRTENGYTKTTTATGPQGNTATRSAQGVWDPATKTWTKTVTTSGGN